MADNLLAQALSQTYGPQASTANLIGQAVMQTPLVYGQNTSPQNAFFGSLAKNMIGSGLQAYGQRRSQDLMSQASQALAQALSQQYTNPMATQQAFQQNPMLQPLAGAYQMEQQQQAQNMALQMQKDQSELARVLAGQGIIMQGNKFVPLVEQVQQLEKAKALGELQAQPMFSEQGGQGVAGAAMGLDPSLRGTFLKEQAELSAADKMISHLKKEYDRAIEINRTGNAMANVNSPEYQFFENFKAQLALQAKQLLGDRVSEKDFIQIAKLAPEKLDSDAQILQKKGKLTQYLKARASAAPISSSIGRIPPGLQETPEPTPEPTPPPAKPGFRRFMNDQGQIEYHPIATPQTPAPSLSVSPGGMATPTPTPQATPLPVALSRGM